MVDRKGLHGNQGFLFEGPSQTMESEFTGDPTDVDAVVAFLNGPPSVLAELAKVAASVVRRLRFFNN